MLSLARAFQHCSLPDSEQHMKMDGLWRRYAVDFLQCSFPSAFEPVDSGFGHLTLVADNL
jgi:hypothetical protein